MIRKAGLIDIIEQPIMTEYILSSNGPEMFISIDRMLVYNKCLNFKQKRVFLIIMWDYARNQFKK